MSHGLEGRSIENLKRAFRNDQTEENYLIKLRMFFDSCGVKPDDFVAIAKKSPAKAERLVSSYIQARKEQVSGHTIRIFRVALRLFLSMNDSDTLNWVRIGKILPPTRRYGSDRAPTPDELEEDPRQLRPAHEVRRPRSDLERRAHGGLRLAQVARPRARQAGGLRVRQAYRVPRGERTVPFLHDAGVLQVPAGVPGHEREGRRAGGSREPPDKRRLGDLQGRQRPVEGCARHLEDAERPAGAALRAHRAEVGQGGVASRVPAGARLQEVLQDEDGGRRGQADHNRAY